jgi:protein-tyrosine-phosphatase
MKKVLCVCYGNKDRSPLMAGVLQMLLDNAGHDVTVGSAGVAEFTKNGGSASEQVVLSGKRIGIDLSDHNKRWIGDLNLGEYDFVVCADIMTADAIFGTKVSEDRIFNANIPNPWPSRDQRDHDEVAELIMSRMYRVVARYFSN